MRLAVAIFAGVLFSGAMSSQSLGDEAKKPNQTTPPSEGDDPFRGLKWGLGVVYSSNLGGVGEVRVDPTTNKVYVTKQHAGAARGAFELHYYFKGCLSQTSFMPYLPGFYDGRSLDLKCRPRYPASGEPHIFDPAFSFGPFVSLNTSPFDSSGLTGSRVFDSIGVGGMLGLHAHDDQNGKFHTLNIGLGAIIDTGVVTLAPGVVPGQVTTLPVDLLTARTTKIGFMAMISYKLFDINLR